MGPLITEIVQAMPKILSGTVLTAVAALIAGLLALLFGIPTGFGRRSHVLLIRSLSTFYVETIRGTPLLLQLIVWYYGTRILLLALFNFNFDTIAYNILTALNSNALFPKTGVSSFFFAVFGLGFNYGAYIAEVIRGGIEAVDHGQTEAAESLGLSRFQTARLIILPQALRIMIPPLTNNFITLVQDTAFVQVLGIYDLSLTVQTSTLAIANSAIRWAFYAVELAIYFVICYSLALVSRRMEQRLAVSTAGAH